MYQKQTWTILLPNIKFIENEEFLIKDDEFHYIANVLRLKPEDEIEATNCVGSKCLCKIIHFTKKEVKVLILKVWDEIQSPYKVNLYLGLPKPSTLEEVISNASEIGVDEIHLFKTEKCISKAPVKLEKLQRISQEALRINKSSRATKVFEYENIHTILAKNISQFENALNLFCDESHIYNNKVTNTLLGTLQEKFKTINIFIGPEASFSDREREIILLKFKCAPVSLGARILRVPNAVSSALAVINQFFLRSA